MKNNHLFKFYLLLSLSLSFAAKAQQEPLSPLINAIRYVESNTPKEKVSILKAYSPDLIKLKENKFIDIPESFFGFADTIDRIELSSAQSSEGNPLGSPLIDALGTVIAERFKEELTLAFLESFREKLKAEPYLGTLFANTKNVLLNDDPFNHKVWILSFRGALDEDLRMLPENMPALLEAIKRNADLDTSLVSTLDLLIAAYNPALEFARDPEKSYSSIVGFLENIKNIYSADIGVSSGLTIAYIMAKELGNANYRDWANKISITKLSNPEILKTYIGFTIEKHKAILTNISFDLNGNKTNLYDYTRSADSEKVKFLIQYSGLLVNQVISISEIVNDLKTKNSGSALKYADYTSLIHQSLETIELLTDSTFFRIINPTATPNKKLKNVIHYTNLSVDFVSNIKSNISMDEYAKIVVNTLSYIREFVPQNKLDNCKELREFVKYADLAVNLAGAATAEEMASAIEGAMLPTKSFRLKRNSYFSVSINSYAGVFYAGEFLTNEDAKNEVSGVTGFTAPIGVSVNWGIYGKKPSTYSQNTTKLEVFKNSDGTITKVKKSRYFKGHSLSLFATIIDVGAISTFRLMNDETPVNSIQWQNIFAPGAYLIWGIGKTPLALSIGAQFGPELRKVTSNNGVITPTINTSAWRFGASLTVDIPFFYLYSKTEKVKTTLDKN